MSPKRSKPGRKRVVATDSSGALTDKRGDDPVNVLKPLQVFRGTVEQLRDATVLRAGGITLELLTEERVPGNQEELRKARARTAGSLRPSLNQSVLVQGRQEGSFIVATLVAEPLEPLSTPSVAEHPAFRRVQMAIARHGGELRAMPGVIAVRPGYRFRNGWITDQPCVVVTVRKKIDAPLLPRKVRLPRTIGGVPVDVEPATPTQQILANPISAQAATAASLSMSATPSVNVPSVPANVPTQPQVLAPALVRASKYIPPPGVKLDPVQGPMNVLCHVSPDAGWPTLSKFLQDTQQRLTVAMYDFTAPHILTGVKSAIEKAKATFRLILDPGVSLSAGNDPINPKANDFPEDKVENDLATVLGKKFSFEWAAVSHQGKTTGGIFPTAYHIKVAVRDGKSFWLSSGNWQSSNQPNLDPLGPDKSLPGLQTTYNREWHVILDHQGLAGTYEKFINWDFSQAGPFQAAVARRTRPDLFVPQELLAEAVTKPQFFPPKSIPITAAEGVQPLLTPDNYADHVLAVIQSAKKTLYFQNQYINIAKQNPDKFTTLVNALRSKIDEGVDVRIILRDIGNTRQMLETLKQNKFDMSKIRVQKACHNKGMIVDGSIAIVGSHNWSNDGTVYNRDASLIFFSSAIAKYYAPIFLYDWENLAHQNVSGEQLMPQIAEAGAATPEGTVRVPWDAYFGDIDQSEVDDALDATLADRVVSSPSVQITEVRSGRPAPLTAAGTQPFGAQSASNGSDLYAAKVEMSTRYLKSQGRAVRRVSAGAASAAPHQNVVGVGVGEKISDGKATGVLSVKFFVQLKYAESQIRPEHLLPKVVAGLPVDVEPVGILRPHASMPNPRVQWRPAQPGCSIGFRYPARSSNRMAGTLGAVVVDAEGTKYILSNNHVLADEGRLKKGAPIFQAGILDLDASSAASEIAKLSRWISFDQSKPLKVDCALAEPVMPDLLSKQILQIGAPQGTTDAVIDMMVHKFGRTTGYTAGRITSINADVVIGYETGTYTFEDQIMIISLDSNSFSMSGDSGALVVQRGPGQLAVGLLFAGSTTHSTANHISDVLQALQVKLP